METNLPKRTDPPSPRTQWRAVLWMLGAVASFTAMALSVRELSDSLSVYQILFLRSAVGLPLIVGAAVAFGGTAGLRRLRTANIRLQFVRNCIHIFGQLAWIYGLSVLPLATVFAVEFSSPLWAVLLAVLFLHEYPTRPQKIGLLLGFLGILTIVRPGLDGISWDLVMVLFAALAYAGAHLSTRILARTDLPISIAFWMCLIQTPLGLAVSLIDWRPVGVADVPAILVLAASGLTAHQCLSSALRLAPLARVLPFDYLRLPLIAVIGAAFYGEALDPFVLVGGGIVLSGVIITQVARQGGGAAAPAQVRQASGTIASD
ncbi:MAG TPA: DMT family transporter [Alphaproteobacteria bacterium]